MARSASVAPISHTEFEELFSNNNEITGVDVVELCVPTSHCSLIKPRSRFRNTSTVLVSTNQVAILVNSLMHAARTRLNSSDGTLKDGGVGDAKFKRNNSVSRLFNTSEEVFKAWEGVVNAQRPLRKKMSAIELGDAHKKRELCQRREGETFRHSNNQDQDKKFCDIKCGTIYKEYANKKYNYGSAQSPQYRTHLTTNLWKLKKVPLTSLSSSSLPSSSNNSTIPTYSNNSAYRTISFDHQLSERRCLLGQSQYNQQQQNSLSFEKIFSQLHTHNCEDNCSCYRNNKDNTIMRKVPSMVDSSAFFLDTPVKADSSQSSPNFSFSDSFGSQGNTHNSVYPVPRSSSQTCAQSYGSMQQRTIAPISIENVGWLKSAPSLRRSHTLKHTHLIDASSITTNANGEVLLTQGEMSGSIDTVLDKSIVNVNIDEVYTIYKQLGTGRFGYVKLAEHKHSNKKIALKFFPRSQIKQAEFLKEYKVSRFLSPHPNIIDTFEGIFYSVNDCAFFFVQEFCPCASLREAVEATNGTGIGEVKTKNILLKVIAAIEFMHDEGLVHRNIKAENILIFDQVNYLRIKVTDFGLTRKINSTVKHLEYVNAYHAPELCETVVREVLTVARSIDIWALGITFFYALKGRFPWPKATIMCKAYWEWDQWLKHKLPQLPKQYDVFHEKALKLFKRCLNPKPKDRWTIKDLKKFVGKERILKAKVST